MSLVVDYYFSPQSPWTYLGHERFLAIAKAADARVVTLPMDLGAKVFPVSGGLPLAQRPKQRQAYRLLELKRYSEYLGLPLNLHPTYFPVDADLAARLLVAVDAEDGTGAALALASRVLRGVWVEQSNIADGGQLAAYLAAEGLPAARLAAADSDATAARYLANSQRAIEAGVFGAPSFIIDGELFWGQDRLDFVARRLARG